MNPMVQSNKFTLNKQTNKRILSIPHHGLPSQKITPKNYPSPFVVFDSPPIWCHVFFQWPPKKTKTPLSTQKTSNVPSTLGWSSWKLVHFSGSLDVRIVNVNRDPFIKNMNRLVYLHYLHSVPKVFGWQSPIPRVLSPIDPMSFLPHLEFPHVSSSSKWP